MSVTAERFKKRRTTTLLAGIRADETTFIAFPCACSRRSVASDESGIIHEAKKLKNHPFVLPLRGQRRLKVLARQTFACPAVTLSCFPLNCGV